MYHEFDYKIISHKNLLFKYTNQSFVCYPMTYISYVPQICLQVRKTMGNCVLFFVNFF